MDKQRKLQKFSIRKYTVGTCSILIGTLIFLGLPTHDAFASENVIQKHAQEEKAEGKSTDPVDEASAIEESSNVEGTKEIGTAKTPAEQPKEEATTEAPTVDETTQDTTTNEETTTEDKSTTETASTEEATQVDTVAPEAAKVETVEKAEQPKAESIEVAKEETSIEETAETTVPASNTEDVVQPASVEETPAVDTPTVEATVTNTISDVDANSVSSKSLEDIVNNQNKDKVEATTLEQPSRQAPRTGENYSSVFRAAVLQTRNVSNYNQLLAALNDRNVGKIVFNNDITMPNPTKNIFGVKNDSQKLNLNASRAVTIDLNKHLFDTAKNYFEMDTNGKNQPGWNITFSNGHINTQDNRPGSGRRPRGLIQYGSNSHDQIINFRDITHTGVTLVNDENLKVNISGEFTSHQTGKLGANENLTIAANEIRISNGSTINMTMTAEGKVFKLYTTREGNERDKLKGILAFGDNTKVNIEAYDPKFYDYGNNSQDIFYVEGKGSRITFGDNNKITLKGQDIFNFDSEYAMVSFGENNTVNVDQRGNGQIINMHDNSDFELGRGTQFLATSNGKINQGRPSPRDNTLVRFKAISRLIIKEDATFKLDAINHLRNANTGKVHSHNALFVMEGWRGAASEIILKNNATFDLRTDNTDFDHSEVLVLPNLSSNDTSLKIEGTAKYVNIQRTATTRHPNKNTAMIYGDGKAIITWKGDHRVMTWNTNHLSDKNKTYENLVNGDTSNPDHVWNNINNFTARLYNHELTVESLSDPKNPDASSRNTPLSNIDRNTSNHKNISSMNAGDITRFVLIGHDVELTSIEERNTVFTAIQDESKQKGEHNITQEGRDGLRTKYTTRLKNNEGNGYVTSSYIRDKNGNPITPIEKHVDVNTLEVTEEDIEFKTIYEADTIKLTTEPNETIQEGINGKKKVSTVYKLNEETGELIETVETAEDGTQTNPVVTEETLLEKQDKIIKVGAKEVTTEDIQPTVEYEDDPNLPSGIEEVADEGIPGKKTVTTIYNIDPETGNRTTVANTNEEISKEPTRKIVKRGIGTNADLNTPGYSDTPRETKPGKAVDVPQNDDTELPAGTKFSIPSDRVPAGWTATINPDNGNVTATPPADAASGTTADIPVEVTYPDGTKDTATAKVTVVPNEAQGNNPNYGNEPVPTKPGVAKNVPQTGDNTLPPGTTYKIPEGAKIPDGWTATVDPNTGVVTVTPPDNSSNGDSANIPVKVKYPDGSSDDTTVPIKVVTNQAEDHTPGYEDQTTIPGKTLEVSQSGDKKLPSGTKFEILEDSVPDGWIATVDPITGVATVTPPANSNGDESERITVLVKYPDGTSEETEFIVELSIPNSTAYQPTYGKEPIPVKRGTATEVSLKDNDAPKGSVFEIDEKSVPNGWTATINPETGAITVTSPTNIPGGTVQDFGVLVKYPDSTSELIPVKVIVDDINSSSDDNGGSDANPDSNNGSDSAADSNSDSNSNSGSDMNSDSNNDSGSNTNSSSDSNSNSGSDSATDSSSDLDANNSGSNTDSNSDKDSNSANDSSSDSNSNSGSDSATDSSSDSDPNNNSGSNTDSSSDSKSNSGSDMNSDSNNDSGSNTNSSSDSNSNSGSDMNSGSNTDSSSVSNSNSGSDSATDSNSATDSSSDSDANNDSGSNIDSSSDSDTNNSGSNTDSSSDSQSDKDSNSANDSNSDSNSNSGSDMNSDSNNNSGSDANPDSNNGSDSAADSNSANDSSSDSEANGGSDSSSTSDANSNSDSDSNSNSGSDTSSDANNNSNSNTDSSSENHSNKDSNSANDSSSDSNDNTGSDANPDSNNGSSSATDSNSDSNTNSGSDSQSDKDSNSANDSSSDSDSNSNSGSDSATDNSSDSDSNNSGSNTDSSSDSQSDKDSNSANDSSSDSNSNSGSDISSDANNGSGSDTDSSSDANPDSNSGSNSDTDGNSDSNSNSGSDSQSDKDSNSANDSNSDSNSNSGSDSATDNSSDSDANNSVSNTDSSSDSNSTSGENSTSDSDSNSVSDSNSTSDSDSNSGSTSDSNTDSSSDSNSTSNSGSDSDSDKDTDGDGTPDKDDKDIDGDGVSNEDEKLIGTDPNNPDTDGNGVSDGDEDHDSDGVPNKDESDPKSDKPTDKDGDGKPDISTPKDTDGDGITDKDDTDIDGDGINNEDEKLIGTDPTNTDTDHDGISDGDEDHDGDGIPNKEESDPNYDKPTNKDGDGKPDIETPKDTDGDGIPDKDDTDIDGDGVNNEDEKLIGTDPTNPDTDGNGKNDGEEDFDNDGVTNQNESDPESNKPTDENGDGKPDITTPDDTDDDGILDKDETDKDGDGINDEDEILIGTDPLDPDTNSDGVNDGDEDHDGDGIPNKDESNPNSATPTDKDGDGKPDITTPHDTDSDGIPDIDDEDIDGDGVNNEDEKLIGTDPTNPDTDGNGVSDGDEDYDSDGIPNKDESNPNKDKVTDKDGNGKPDITTPQDTDGDGIPDKEDTDIDGDGINNEDEKLIGTNPNNPDTDHDGIPDGDEDHDGDGIPNKDESNPNSDKPTDKDYDGKPDVSTPTDPNKDTDGDGKPDRNDNDIDGDGVNNEDEKLIGTDPLNPDTDGNGVNDGDEDYDNDGYSNKHESNPKSDKPTDKDGDGKPDISTPTDTDGDGIIDLDDPDIDGDGINDYDEIEIGTDPLNPDTNGNGIPDGDEDHDGDGIPNKDESDPNSFDVTDKDGDGKPDISTPKDTDGDGIPDKDDNDIDGDGVNNEDEKLIGTDPTKVDTDGNGIDDGDEDYDGDGYSNKTESNRKSDKPTDRDGDGKPDITTPADTDGDGIIDKDDTDVDGDGINDYDEIVIGTDPLNPDTNGNGINDGDEDYDGDGIPNKDESNPNSFDVTDKDGDGKPDISTPKDTDGDGTPDKDDNDIDDDGVSNKDEELIGTDPTKADTDGNGIPDGDEDHDKDGIPNKDESDPKSDTPTDKDGDGKPDISTPKDTDVDGTPDKDDNDIDGDGVSNKDEELIGTDPTKADTDGNGIPDGDEDHDKDGIPNKDESDPKSDSPTDKDGDGKPDITTPSQYASNTPGYDSKDQSPTPVKPGSETKVPQTGDKELPPGTKFEVPADKVPNGWTVEVDPNTGDLTIVPPKDVTPGTEVDIPVTVTYPDGSTEELPVKVVVEKSTDKPADKSNADDNSPGYDSKDQGSTQVKPGSETHIPQTGDKELPPGTKFEVPADKVPSGWTVEVDPNTGDLTIIPPKDVTPGTEVEIPVTVTYPDGSTEELPVKVVVEKATENSQADDNSPGYDSKDQGSTPVKPGSETHIPQSGDKELPPSTKFEVPADKVPSGWTVTVDPNTGDITVVPPKDVTPGTEVEIPVTVTYPDGSTKELPVKVVVEKSTDKPADKSNADDNSPGYDSKDQGPTPVKPGSETHIPQTGDKELPPGTKFEVPADKVPSGWTVEVDPNTGDLTIVPPKDVTPGTEVEIPVTVTYPDGSTEELPVKVVVEKATENSQADDNSPGYDSKDQGSTPVKPGSETHIPQSGDKELPPSTKFEVPADKVPSGWTVTVDPNTGDITVVPPKDVTPGTEVEIPVTVTYPDGSTKELPVKVVVEKSTDKPADKSNADDNSPGYDSKDQGPTPVKPGSETHIPQTGDKELPPGTKFEVPADKVPSGWTVEVDPNTGDLTIVPPKDVTPGTEVEIPVTVTYPDGSTEELPVKVVVEKATDKSHADDNSPGYGSKDQGPTPVKPGSETKVPQTGDKELPPGTKFDVPADKVPSGWTVEVDPKTGDLTIVPPKDVTPGTEVDIPVTVTYPDGSTEELPVKVVVEKPADKPAGKTQADDNTPGYGSKDQGPTPVKPGTSTHIPQTGDKELPPGTKFEVPSDKVPSGWTVTVDPNTGDITVVPPKDVTPGTKVDIPVTVTYPDGSKQTVTVGVVVEKASDNTDAGSSNMKGMDSKAADHAGHMAQTEQQQSTNGMESSKDNMMNKDNKEQAKVLPDTGETPAENATLFGSLFAGLGSLFLFGRRKKEEEEQ